MSWQDISAIGTLTALVVACGTIYLRLYISNELARSENNLMHKLHEQFVPASVADLRFSAIEQRLEQAEENIRHLQEA